MTSYSVYAHEVRRSADKLLNYYAKTLANYGLAFLHN